MAINLKKRSHWFLGEPGGRDGSFHAQRQNGDPDEPWVSRAHASGPPSARGCPQAFGWTWRVDPRSTHFETKNIRRLCLLFQFTSFQSLSRVWPFKTHGQQHVRPPCPLPTPGACSNSCPLSQWCHPTISSSVVPFSSCLQSYLASGSFPVSQFFASGGQTIGASASASTLPMNIQDWFLLGLAGFISLQSKRLSRVFSNTTVQNHQFFGAQLSLWSNSHIHTWLLEKIALTRWNFVSKVMSAF